MTALAGVWRLDGRPDAAELCGRVLNAQRLYGLHGLSSWSDGDVALGRQLMRTLPEDRFDQQPVRICGGRCVLVADVRLDNRDELLSTFGINGSSGARLSDAAVLGVAVERWGDRCVEHLVGDYAFAVWDADCRRIVLARDPIGQRPLHFHRSQRFFAFASMPKGLHALDGIPYAPDQARVAADLAQLPEFGSRTFFQGIDRVEPGQIVMASQAGVTSRRFWEPRPHNVRLRGPDEYVEAARALLDQAVRCRLRGADDVGAHLSGGFDSQAVTATAARLLAPTGRRVVAFTAAPRQGYERENQRLRFVDESAYATATAALYPNIEHVLVRSSLRSPLSDIDRSFFLFDRPAAALTNAGWFNGINDAARARKIGVVLTGGKGNLGLSYHGRELLPELMLGGRWLRYWRETRAYLHGRNATYRTALALTFGPWCPPALWSWLYRRLGRPVDTFDYSSISRSAFGELGLAQQARASGADIVRRPAKNAFRVRLDAIRSTDAANYKKGFLAGWGVDLRDPLGDVRLLEFCLSVPTEQYLSNGTTRALARRVLADRVPDIVLREDRRGEQAADWHESLTAARGDIAAELDRIAACAPAASILDIPRLKRLMDDWPADGWDRGRVSRPYRHILLRAIATGHFLRKASGVNA